MSSNTLSNIPVAMSSREIAELTSKRHDHVLRDIDNLLESLSPELGNGFQSSTYVSGDPPREYRQYLMDRDSSYCLVAGYDANSRMRIIKRWQELESKASQSIPSTPAPSLPLTLAQLQPEVTAALALAEMAGFTGNQLKLSADKAIKTRYNTSWLALVDASALPADPRGMTYTPTELGKSDEFKTQFGYTLSACKTNRFLAAYGLQSNQTGAWIPTEAAKGHYEWLDTGKRHTDGTPVKQLKWFKSVLTKMTAFHHQEAA